MEVKKKRVPSKRSSLIILDLRKIKEENYFKVPSFERRGTSVRECISCTAKCQRPGLVNRVEKCQRGGWGFRWDPPSEVQIRCS